MVAVPDLLDSDGDSFSIQEGESMNITGQLVDAAGNDITLAALSTIKISLYNEIGNDVINSREDEDAKNANDHTVASDGSFIIRLDEDDSIIVTQDPTVEETEKQYHVIRIKWTWDDGTKVRTGLEHARFGVQKLEALV